MSASKVAKEQEDHFKNEEIDGAYRVPRKRKEDQLIEDNETRDELQGKSGDWSGVDNG